MDKTLKNSIKALYQYANGDTSHVDIEKVHIKPKNDSNVKK